GLRAPRVDEIAARLPHQADPSHTEEAPEPEEEAARADQSPSGVVPREMDTELLHRLHPGGQGGGSKDARLLDHAALGEARERVDLADSERRAVAEDPFGDLVLTLGTDPLEIPAEDQDVVRGGGRCLPVGDLV